MAQTSSIDSSSEPVSERAVADALGRRGGPGAWAEYLLVRGLLSGVGRLPHGVQMRMIDGLARLAVRFERRHTEAARMFQRQALGCARTDEDGEELARQAWRHLFRITVDANAFQRRVPIERLLEHYTVDACDEFRAVVAERRGGLFITPHVGDWEAGSAALPVLGCEPLYVIARPPSNRPLSAHLLRLRRERRIQVLPRRGGMEHIRALVRAGAWVAFLPDQRPTGRSVVAPFFGRPAHCERAVGTLVRRLGVPVVFGSCYLSERPFHYEVRIPRVVRPEELSGRSIEEVTTLVNAELERLILARPEQYYWLHDRWRGVAPDPSEGSTE